MHLADWIQVSGLGADVLGVVLVAVNTPHMGKLGKSEVWGLLRGSKELLFAGWALLIIGFLAQIAAVLAEGLYGL